MKRIGYAIATVILLLIEVLIAIYVHDAFVRPYIGDVLVVVVIYTFIRIFVPERCKLLPLYVFIFAALVEALQMFHIVEALGWQKNRFLSILVGSVFDWKDILCYAICSPFYILSLQHLIHAKQYTPNGITQDIFPIKYGTDQNT